MTDLPCPFCGDIDPSVDSITDADEIEAPEYFFLTCGGCGAQGPGVTCGPDEDRDEAAERAAGLWNGRVALTRASTAKAGSAYEDGAA